jgi:L-asparaginase
MIIYTGGTIGMVKDYKTNALKAFDFDNLKRNIPELNLINCKIDTISFENPLDSSNIHPDDWVQIASIIEINYEKYDGFVVLHGSDTMSYTASAISFMFENLNKPIIFTGSQLPIGDLRTDAKENLITSIQIASSQVDEKPIITEVCLYFEYKLYRANRTTKINAEHFEAFSSPNYPPLAESGVHLKFNNDLLFKPQQEGDLIVRKKLNNNIAILKMFPGITESLVKSFLDTKGLKGVILETYGSGNAPTKKWFVEALKNAIKKGIYIVDVTQCVGGSVILGQYETSTQLQELGLISGFDITTESAVAKMMYLLGVELNDHKFEELFIKSLRGEMSNL